MKSIRYKSSRRSTVNTCLILGLLFVHTALLSGCVSGPQLQDFAITQIASFPADIAGSIVLTFLQSIIPS